MTLLSSGGVSGCSGGNRPDILLGSDSLDLQIQAEGIEWIGRLRTPQTGDFQLRLQAGEDGVTVTGTIRGHVEHSPTIDGHEGSVDISQPVTVDGRRLIVGPPLRIFGSASGEIVYDKPILGRVTCTSALWTLGPPPQF